MRWSVVVLLLLSSLVPSLDGLRIVHHARLQRQQVLAADAVASDASAVVGVSASASSGAGAGTEALRLAFCNAWGAFATRANTGAGAGYFAFSYPPQVNGPPNAFWVPNAVAACPDNMKVATTVAGCITTCVGTPVTFAGILDVRPHIHWAEYIANPASTKLRLSMKGYCTNSQNYHWPDGLAPVRTTVATSTGLATARYLPVAATETTGALPGIGCLATKAEHAYATATIAAWNSMFV